MFPTCSISCDIHSHHLFKLCAIESSEYFYKTNTRFDDIKSVWQSVVLQQNGQLSCNLEITIYHTRQHFIYLSSPKQTWRQVSKTIGWGYRRLTAKKLKFFSMKCVDLHCIYIYIYMHIYAPHYSEITTGHSSRLFLSQILTYIGHSITTGYDREYLC
jgi:hypothetical protein